MNSSLRSGARIMFGKLLPRIAYPVVRGPLRGARFILGALAGVGGGATVYFNMMEAEQTAAFINTLSDGQVLFDVGANVGYYTILGSRLVGPRGKVIAIEPVLRNLVYLHQHIRLNRAINVSVVSAACSDTLSLSVFSSGHNFATGSLLAGHRAPSDSEGDSFLVPTVTIDALVEQLDVPPTVIKVDVEGAELAVLQGAQVTLSKVKPRIFLSTHSDALRSACMAYLTEFGYMFDVLSHDESNPSEFLAR